MRGWWRRRRLSRAEAQRLLDGGSGDSTVAGLLRAAAGPARPDELAGERAAVAAFRQEYAARSAATTKSDSAAGSAVRAGSAAGALGKGLAGAGAAGAGAAGRRGGVRRGGRSGRRVAVLAAVLAAGVLAGTGIAAGAGRLPAPLQRAAHDWIERVPEPGTAPRPERTVRAASPTAPTAPPVPRPATSTAPPPAPPAAGNDLRKLCRDWEKARDDPHRKPMDPQDLRTLADAAGGPDRIEAFCGLTPTGSASPPPGPPGSTKSKKATRP